MSRLLSILAHESVTLQYHANWRALWPADPSSPLNRREAIIVAERRTCDRYAHSAKSIKPLFRAAGGAPR